MGWTSLPSSLILIISKANPSRSTSISYSPFKSGVTIKNCPILFVFCALATFPSASLMVTIALSTMFPWLSTTMPAMTLGSCGGVGMGRFGESVASLVCFMDGILTATMGTTSYVGDLAGSGLTSACGGGVGDSFSTSTGLIW